MPGESSVTITGTGFAAFDSIEFTEEGIYTYTVSERNTAEEHYVYDDTVYTVTVTVSEKDGKLYANVAVSGGEAVFTNVYAEEGVVLVEETTTPVKPTDVPVVTSPEDKPTGEYFIDENGIPRAIYVNEFGEEYYLDEDGIPRAVWYLPKTGYGPNRDWLLVGIGNLALIVMLAALRKKKKAGVK